MRGQHPNLYEYNGELKTLVQLSKICGINRNCIYKRIRAGWALSDAIVTVPERDPVLLKKEYKAIIDDGMHSWRVLMSKKYTSNYMALFRMIDYRSCSSHYKEILNQHDIAA